VVILVKSLLFITQDKDNEYFTLIVSLK